MGSTSPVYPPFTQHAHQWPDRHAAEYAAITENSTATGQAPCLQPVMGSVLHYPAPFQSNCAVAAEREHQIWHDYFTAVKTNAFMP